MRRAVGALIAGVALAVAGAAPAADIGANDDTGKWTTDSGSVFFSRMAESGLRQSVMTVRWTPSDPLSIPNEDALGLAIQTAELAGLRVVLAVYPYPTREIEAGLARPAAFGIWLTGVATRYPTVKQYAVMNEPNQPAFLRPQFRGDGSNVSAAIAGSFLAAGYDALKAVDQTIVVVGLGLSPRGNDQPNAPNNISTSPVRFLAALGTWYRASGRQLPLMDGIGFHPYPERATDPLTRSSAWPNAGFADLGRIKQAIWDAFRDTPQPTTMNGLRLYLDEVGWQVATDGLPGYAGEENVPVTNVTTQAGIYASLVRSVACDPQVAELNFFGFYDDAERGGFQAALHQVDGTPRASAAAVRAAITETATGCAHSVAPWFPARRVIGAVAPSWVVVDRRTIRFSAEAGEGANIVACLLPGRLGASAAAAAMTIRTAASIDCHGGKVLPHRPAVGTLRRVGALVPATVGVRVVAESSDRRVRTFSRTVR